MHNKWILENIEIAKLLTKSLKHHSKYTNYYEPTTQIAAICNCFIFQSKCNFIFKFSINGICRYLKGEKQPIYSDFRYSKITTNCFHFVELTRGFVEELLGYNTCIPNKNEFIDTIFPKHSIDLPLGIVDKEFNYKDLYTIYKLLTDEN